MFCGNPSSLVGFAVCAREDKTMALGESREAMMSSFIFLAPPFAFLNSSGITNECTHTVDGRFPLATCCRPSDERRAACRATSGERPGRWLGRTDQKPLASTHVQYVLLFVTNLRRITKLEPSPPSIHVFSATDTTIYAGNTSPFFSKNEKKRVAL